MTQVLITGDFAPARRLERLVLSGAGRDIYGNFYPHLKDNDLTITNLECPLTNSGNKIPKVGPNLKAHPQCVSALIDGNFNLVTLANNHILDFGMGGLRSTIEVCQANNINFVGAGSDLNQARQPFYFEKDDLVIAILNFAENEFSNATTLSGGANPLDLPTNFLDIQKAKENADYVILIVHGGHEYNNIPSPETVKRYRFFVDAGANIVIGHHPHHYSGYEKYKNGLVFYSLGNFLFDSGKSSIDNRLWHIGYAVKLVLSKEEDIKYELIPYTQLENTNSVNILSDEADKTDFYQSISEINDIIQSDSRLSEYWNSWVQQKTKSFTKHLIPVNNRYIRHVIYKFNLLPKAHRLKLLNYARCESHRELLIAILNGEMEVEQ